MTYLKETMQKEKGRERIGRIITIQSLSCVDIYHVAEDEEINFDR